ncbi:hypothetical protein JG687_00004498 [Phytophthora cactorum]|uniref:Uncharacterized protein n=1 Tax=Phytophthora cactorum TaxID=29920 RepID=A0A8T1UNJ6_9STRA|nr:hypothetical protein JG687_00004498 [Phytophthora cactorum]
MVITGLLTMVLWRQTIRRNGRFWRTKDIKVSETMTAAFTPKRAINSPPKIDEKTSSSPATE